MTTKKTTAKKTAAKKQTPKTAQAWNNVKGLMRVWATNRAYKKKSWFSFSTSIGKKNEAPEVDEGAFEINVKKGFLTLTVYSDGSVHPAVMVMEYDIKGGDEDGEDEDEDTDELPF